MSEVILPKFKVGDVVCFDNDFSYNPADGVLTVAKVEAIHIFRKKGLFVGKDKTGTVKYSLTGVGLIMKECDLKRY